jgi:hypothetical protein
MASPRMDERGSVDDPEWVPVCGQGRRFKLRWVFGLPQDLGIGKAIDPV